jgi:hypothetical protein
MFDEWIDESMLMALKSDTISKLLYEIMVKTPEIGQMFMLFAYMYYDLFNDASRAQLTNFVNNTRIINMYRKKFEIIVIISKHVPKLDLNMNIPQELYPLFNLFGIQPTPDMHIKFLSDYINTHLPILFNYITTHVSLVEQTMNNGFAKLKAKYKEIKFGGKKSKKRRFKSRLSRKSRKYFKN